MEITKKIEFIIDAGDVAKKRLYDYLEEKLKGEMPETKWEFYTYLLELAKGHKLDLSGYGSCEYQDDRAAAKSMYKKQQEEIKKSHCRVR
jgi:hypothetical protein